MSNERTVMFQLPSVLSGTLACIAGTVAGRSWELSAGTFVIGRLEASDLHLPSEPGVSKTHAKIVAEGDRYVLVDCESRNGTIVNGAPIQRHVLRDGDEIRICGCVLRFTQRGGGTQVKVRNEAPREAYEPPPAAPVASAAARAAAPVVAEEPSSYPPSPPLSPPAPARGRVLATWYAGGLMGALLFGGTGVAVLALTSRPADATDAVVASAGTAASAMPEPSAEAPAEAKPEAGAADAEKKADPAEPAPEADNTAGRAPPDASPPAPVPDAAAPPGAAASAQGAADAAVAAAADAKARDDSARADGAGADDERARASQERRTTPRKADPAASSEEDEAARTFPATPEGGRSETLKSSGGRVATVEAKDGDIVGKDQVLVTFDDGENSDEIATLKDRIASLEGAEDEDAKRELKAARAKLEALTSSTGGPVVAGMAGKLTGFSVTIGTVIKPGEVIGRIVEGEISRRVKVKVDRASRAKKGQEVTLVLRKGGEAPGTVSSVVGKLVTVETGQLAADEVESVRF